MALRPVALYFDTEAVCVSGTSASQPAFAGYAAQALRRLCVLGREAGVALAAGHSAVSFVAVRA